MNSEKTRMNINPDIGQVISQAWRRMILVCFRPFDLGKWAVMAFGAWLAHLADGGGSFNFNIGGGDRGSLRSTVHSAGESLSSFWHQYGWIVLMAGVFVVIFLVLLGLLALWLSSRGKMVFVDNVVQNKARIGIPWSAHAAAGNSLFVWRLLLGLILLTAVAAVLILGAVSIIPMIRQERILWPGLTGGILAVFGLLGISLIGGFVAMATQHFMVPIMVARGVRAVAAWKEFLRLFGTAPLSFILFALMLIGINIAVTFLLIAGILMTCCCLWCLMVIPYINAIVLLPLYVFYRALGPAMLEQFGYVFEEGSATEHHLPA